MIAAIDQTAFEAKGLQFARSGNIGTFTVPPPSDRPNDPPRVVTVTIVGDQLHFFAHRSSGQKRIITLLGLDDA